MLEGELGAEYSHLCRKFARTIIDIHSSLRTSKSRDGTRGPKFAFVIGFAV